MNKSESINQEQSSIGSGKESCNYHKWTVHQIYDGGSVTLICKHCHYVIGIDGDRIELHTNKDETKLVYLDISKDKFRSFGEF